MVPSCGCLLSSRLSSKNVSCPKGFLRDEDAFEDWHPKNSHVTPSAPPRGSQMSSSPSHSLGR